MSAFLDDVGNWLIAKQVVNGSTGWQLFKSLLPPSPDQAVCLYETPGNPPDIISNQSSEQPYDYPGLQVRVRASRMDYVSMRNQIQLIFKTLHQSEPMQGQQEFIYLYSINSGPLPMGVDENDRPEATWNFRAMRSRS